MHTAPRVLTETPTLSILAPRDQEVWDANRSKHIGAQAGNHLAMGGLVMIGALALY